MYIDFCVNFTYNVNKIVLILLEMNVCNSFYNSRKKIIKIKKTDIISKIMIPDRWMKDR